MNPWQVDGATLARVQVALVFVLSFQKLFIMGNPSRKEFLGMSAATLSGLLIDSSFLSKKKSLPLAFSTLGCPDWNFSQVMDFAVANNYTGIELRGIQRQMDLTQCPEFITAQKRSETLALMKQKGLQFVNLGSSANLHIAEAAERKKNLDEARNFIDLAKSINCPYVRVFPNKFPNAGDKEATIELIAKGLKELGDYAREKNVKVLMETHGDAVHIEDILSIMQASAHDHVGLVWDVCNMWTVTKESPKDAYAKLGKYIYHTHIKDAKLENNQPHYILLGKGEVPIFEAIDVLRKNGYKGYYSFEWEKLWHPEIAEPDIALADYPVAMKNHFK
jgi:sugar phosphate isomerase/epimerase